MTAARAAAAAAALVLQLAAAFVQADPLGPAAAAAALDALVARVVADLPEPIVSQLSSRQTLAQRMLADQVPAVSVAVFRDGQLAWARAWGQADVDSGVAATPHTLFQAASISKPVAALGAMRLVDQGKLALDADIGQSISGWQAGAAISLRQLLSHSSALGVPAFQGYAAGQPLPTVLQVLNGTAPANSAAVRLQGQPGQGLSYSGGGYTVLQALMAQRAGQPFEVWMQAAVLQPLGMVASGFFQPLPAALVPSVASGHRLGQAIPGKYNSHPELAAAGLWTTPSDLGRVAAELQNAIAGRPTRLANADMARQMLTPQPGGRGLGFVLDKRAGEPGFQHTGLNAGFAALLAASGNAVGPQHAVVVMVNGEAGTPLAQALLRSIARELGWAAQAPRQVQALPQPLQTLARLEGLYRADDPGAGRADPRAFAIELSGGVAHLRDGGWQRAPLVPLSASVYAVQNRDVDLEFVAAAPGAVPSAVTLLEGGTAQRLQRVAPALAEPATTVPLLRGSFNAWGTQHVFASAGRGQWSLLIDLPAGTASFKLASADWSALNLGAALAAGSMASGQGSRLVPMGDNLVLEVPAAATYRFDIDASDAERPLLRVVRVVRVVRSGDAVAAPLR